MRLYKGLIIFEFKSFDFEMKSLGVFPKKPSMYLNIYVVMAIWYERYMKRCLFKEIRESFIEISGNRYIWYVICDVYFYYICYGVLDLTLTLQRSFDLNYISSTKFEIWPWFLYLIFYIYLVAYKKDLLGFHEISLWETFELHHYHEMSYTWHLPLLTTWDFMKIRFVDINIFRFVILLILLTSLEWKGGIPLFQ